MLRKLTTLTLAIALCAGIGCKTTTPTPDVRQSAEPLQIVPYDATLTMFVRGNLTRCEGYVKLVSVDAKLETYFIGPVCSIEEARMVACASLTDEDC